MTEVKVSVVVPVYNTLPYLAECLDSVLSQDLPAEEFELVAVDDGSTDGSGDLLDRYRNRHPNLTVIHQENSGWPGRPRNVGLAASRGEYVFFCDSDDRLAPRSLRRMHEFAAGHGTDVLVPKMAPLDRPRGAEWVWNQTQVDADLKRAFLTLGPWKLFRKAFLDEHGIRFPEGKVRLEDGILVAEAYLTARRVSLLSDDDYYIKRSQPDRGNISSSPVDPDEYICSVARIMEVIRLHCADRALAESLVATLYRRKALAWVGPDRFGGHDRGRQEAWLRAVAALAEKHVPARLDEQLAVLPRARSVLVRHGELEALAALAAAQRAGRALPTALVDNWFELAVPGLAARPALVVAPGLRLVPGDDPRAGRDRWTASVAGLAQRYVWPVARRSAVGRRSWSWARARLAPGRHR